MGDFNSAEGRDIRFNTGENQSEAIWRVSSARKVFPSGPEASKLNAISDSVK